MHEDDFGKRLMEILRQIPTQRIALICRTGNRSNYVRSQLAAQGVSGIRDISEGMIGNGRAPGWIGRGLPIISLEAADAEYEAVLAKWNRQ